MKWLCICSLLMCSLTNTARADDTSPDADASPQEAQATDSLTVDSHKRDARGKSSARRAEMRAKFRKVRELMEDGNRDEARKLMRELRQSAGSDRFARGPWPRGEFSRSNRGDRGPYSRQRPDHRRREHIDRLRRGSRRSEYRGQDHLGARRPRAADRFSGRRGGWQRPLAELGPSRMGPKGGRPELRARHASGGGTTSELRQLRREVRRLRAIVEKLAEQSSAEA